MRWKGSNGDRGDLEARALCRMDESFAPNNMGNAMTVAS
ncbi:UNVERIFIED_ORG: hypothetical protein J2791_003669 [Burkholderia contaminans]|jgi:hypothetical protein|nr:hypothetical protein [Burkholderia contaminans]